MYACRVPIEFSMFNYRSFHENDRWGEISIEEPRLYCRVYDYKRVSRISTQTVILSSYQISKYKLWLHSSNVYFVACCN